MKSMWERYYKDRTRILEITLKRAHVSDGEAQTIRRDFYHAINNCSRGNHYCRPFEKWLKWRLALLTPRILAWRVIDESGKNSNPKIDCAFIDVIKTMMPSSFPIWTAKEYAVDAKKFLRRIFWRQKQANGCGLTLAIFENDRIDESTKADDLALLATLRNGETQTAQSKGKRGKHERAPGVTNEWIAQQFNQYALPLIAKCYPINNEEDEERIRLEIVPNLKEQRRKFAMKKEYGGLCVYEPMRGGNKSGYVMVGNITANGIKKWIGKYRDESNPEPKSGFHAGMLKSKTRIEEAAREWENYWHGYALYFFEWRKTHTGTPRDQFRYNPPPVIHGAEHTAASVPQS